MDNLQTSITYLANEMIKNEDGKFCASLNIIFMCSAPLQIGDLTPGDLPVENVSLDMYILRDQEIVITSNWVTDETVTMDFPGCVRAIIDRFSQTLILVKQPYNQALVLIDQIFTFVNLNNTSKYVSLLLRAYSACLPHLVKLLNKSRHFLGN